jgi:hypothetical protein
MNKLKLIGALMIIGFPGLQCIAIAPAQDILKDQMKTV